MPKYQERTKEIERWLCFKREEGFVIAKAEGHTYLVNGKKTNVKIAKAQRRDGTFWSSISRKQLDDVDVFVWLIQKAENYYAIPKKKMKECATSWLSSKYDRFYFRLDNTNHEYIAHTRYDISDCYQNNLNSHSPFR